MRNKLKIILVLLIIALLSLTSVIISAEVSVSGNVSSDPTPDTPENLGTLRVETGSNGGDITINGIVVANIPAYSAVVRHQNGDIEVIVGDFVVTPPAGSAISLPSAGALRVIIGATGGTINVNGSNLITASAGTDVLFSANNTTTATVAGTQITMPTSNGPIVTNNANGTITITLPGEPPVTIPANGGNWYSVFFNSSGGNNVAAQIIESGNTINIPSTPRRTGHTFAGWYSNPALTDSWNVGANTISNITTLFARWVVSPPATIIPPQEEPPAAPPPVVVAPPVVVLPSAPYVPVYDTPEEDLNEYEYDEVLEYETYEEYHSDEAEDEEQYGEINSCVDATGIEAYAYIGNNIEEALTAQDGFYYEYRQYEYYEQYEYSEPVILEFTLSNLGYSIDEDVRSLRIINRASLGLQFLHGEIPAFIGGEGLFFTIHYRTNLSPAQRIMANDVDASRPLRFLSPSLQDDEIITEISIEFDFVPAGFGLYSAIVYSFVVLDENNVTNIWTVTSGEETERQFLITEISNNIDRMSGLQNRYDYTSWANLQSVISSVQAVLNNPYSTVAQLQEAYELLLQAIEQLNPVATPRTSLTANIVISIISLIVMLFVVVRLIKRKRRK